MNIFSLDIILQFTLKYVSYNSERHNSQQYIKMKAAVSHIPFSYFTSHNNIT